VIAYRGFSKRYRKVCAVQGLDLAIGPGEVVALLGPNGSGKTTVLKAAAGLLRPTAGDVLLGSRGLAAASPEARRILSFLPQKVAFPESLSGEEAVDFYRRLRGAPPERTAEVLRFASLNGAGRRAIATYSGGMVQRLGLAVAAIPEAPILLLDEPTAALDPDGLCAFYGLVERRKRAGHTTFFSSHQLGDVEHLADRFAVLVEGRLVAALSARQLADRLADRGVMRLRVGPLDAALFEQVRRIAPRARWEGEELVVAGAAAQRPAAIELMRAAGREIGGITIEEGRLDILYLELVKERRV
jgi:Cu-processing system ATP-binding protein